MESLPPYNYVNRRAKVLSFHSSTRGANNHRIFHQNDRQAILSYEGSRYKGMRSTRIKKKCTITGFDGKHTEDYVRFILSFLGSHMVHLPDQLVLSCWGAESSSLTANLIGCRNPTLYLLRTLVSEVTMLPTAVARTHITCNLIGWVKSGLLGRWLVYRALRRVSRTPLGLRGLRLWSGKLIISARRVLLIGLSFRAIAQGLWWRV